MIGTGAGVQVQAGDGVGVGPVTGAGIPPRSADDPPVLSLQSSLVT
jgi:hypothetical protein